MGLPPRQQRMLDQIEQVLQSADPRLGSMFAAFARMTPREDKPATESISGWTMWRKLVVGAVVISLLGSLMLIIQSTKGDCPGLPSDQVVVSAAVRYAGCLKDTAAWSKGGR
ncbi:MAG: DUF3040 domain-containing protein [Streptosporangiaceae bacterium]